MKVFQVALIISLGMADVSLRAQTPPEDRLVLAANEGMPEEAMLFPELISGSHEFLAHGTGMTPAISQALPAAPVQPETPVGPLTGKQRLILFWNEAYASPGMFVGVSAGALVDQVRHTPSKWDGDGSGYTRRFASEYGQLAVRNGIHDGLDAITGFDPRYVACKCEGTLHRGAHALKMSFLTTSQDGRLIVDMPQIASAYGSGIASTYWYPHNQFRPTVQGVQFGHEQMGEIVVSNLIQEFAPDLERRFHLHALTARKDESKGDPDDQ